VAEHIVPNVLKSVLRTSRSTYERPVVVRSSETRNPKLGVSPQAKRPHPVAARCPGVAHGLRLEGELLAGFA